MQQKVILQKDPEKTQKVKAPWFSDLDHYYRRPPRTDEESISDKQMKHRIDFADASMAARNQKGYVNGVPVSAKHVQDRTKKQEEGEPVPSPQEVVDQEIEYLKQRLDAIKLK